MNDTPSRPTKPVVAKPAVKKVVKKSIETPAPAKARKKTTKAVASVAIESPTAAKHGKASKDKAASAKPPKLIRDSFSFPETDYAMIGALKQRALKAGCEVKKSELLRAGLAVLSEMSDDELLDGLAGIVKLKTGRPAK